MLRLLTTFALFLSVCEGISQNPTLSQVIPAAVPPGKTTTVTLVGENLTGMTELWTSFPANTVIDTTNNDSGKIVVRLTPAKEVTVGIGALRLATTNGVSIPHLFMIDDLPSVSEDGTNRSLASAQVVKLPVAVDGHTDETSFDCFRFAARKGQRISVEVVANRLGSSLDPVVRLLDAQGKELVYCDDDPSITGDSRFAYRIPATGQYFLELRDVAYQGGPKFRYRLRLGNFPLASSPFPLGARRGAETKVIFVGPSVEGARPINVRVPEDTVRVPLAVKSPGGQGSGFVTLATGELPELIEIEPDDEPKAATKFFVPAVVNGRFAKPKDRDYFEFEAAKDQRLVFAGRTRSLGSPCDLFMRIYDANGKQIAEANIDGANEGTITNTFKEAGTYHLFVEELNRGGRPDFAYRIEIEPFKPGFALNIETNRVVTTNGGAWEFKVTAARREYDGPITLTLDGLGDGVTLENNVIPEKKNETTLKAKLPESCEPGHLFNVRVVGKARVGDADFETTASTLPALKKLFPLMRYSPPDLDGWIALGIRSFASKPATEKSDERE